MSPAEQLAAVAYPDLQVARHSDTDAAARWDGLVSRMQEGLIVALTPLRDEILDRSKTSQRLSALSTHPGVDRGRSQGMSEAVELLARAAGIPNPRRR